MNAPTLDSNLLMLNAASAGQAQRAPWPTVGGGAAAQQMGGFFVPTPAVFQQQQQLQQQQAGAYQLGMFGQHKQQQGLYSYNAQVHQQHLQQQNERGQRSPQAQTSQDSKPMPSGGSATASRWSGGRGDNRVPGVRLDESKPQWDHRSWSHWNDYNNWSWDYSKGAWKYWEPGRNANHNLERSGNKWNGNSPRAGPSGSRSRSGRGEPCLSLSESPQQHHRGDQYQTFLRQSPSARDRTGSASRSRSPRSRSPSPDINAANRRKSGYATEYKRQYRDPSPGAGDGKNRGRGRSASPGRGVGCRGGGTRSRSGSPSLTKRERDVEKLDGGGLQAQDYEGARVLLNKISSSPLLQPQSLLSPGFNLSSPPLNVPDSSPDLGEAEQVEAQHQQPFARGSSGPAPAAFSDRVRGQLKAVCDEYNTKQSLQKKVSEKAIREKEKAEAGKLTARNTLLEALEEDTRQCEKEARVGGLREVLQANKKTGARGQLVGGTFSKDRVGAAVEPKAADPDGRGNQYRPERIEPRNVAAVVDALAVDEEIGLNAGGGARNHGSGAAMSPRAARNTGGTDRDLSFNRGSSAPDSERSPGRGRRQHTAQLHRNYSSLAAHVADDHPREQQPLRRSASLSPRHQSSLAGCGVVVQEERSSRQDPAFGSLSPDRDFNTFSPDEKKHYMQTTYREDLFEQIRSKKQLVPHLKPFWSPERKNEVMQRERAANTSGNRPNIDWERDDKHNTALARWVDQAVVRLENGVLDLGFKLNQQNVASGRNRPQESGGRPHSSGSLTGTGRGGRLRKFFSVHPGGGPVRPSTSGSTSHSSRRSSLASSGGRNATDFVRRNRMLAATYGRNRREKQLEAVANTLDRFWKKEKDAGDKTRMLAASSVSNNYLTHEQRVQKDAVSLLGSSSQHEHLLPLPAVPEVPSGSEASSPSPSPDRRGGGGVGKELESSSVLIGNLFTAEQPFQFTFGGNHVSISPGKTVGEVGVEVSNAANGELIAKQQLNANRPGLRSATALGAEVPRPAGAVSSSEAGSGARTPRQRGEAGVTDRQKRGAGRLRITEAMELGRSMASERRDGTIGKQQQKESVCSGADTTIRNRSHVLAPAARNLLPEEKSAGDFPMPSLSLQPLPFASPVDHFPPVRLPTNARPPEKLKWHSQHIRGMISEQDLEQRVALENMLSRALRQAGSPTPDNGSSTVLTKITTPSRRTSSSKSGVRTHAAASREDPGTARVFPEQAVASRSGTDKHIQDQHHNAGDNGTRDAEVASTRIDQSSNPNGRREPLIVRTTHSGGAGVAVGGPSGVSSQDKRHPHVQPPSSNTSSRRPSMLTQQRTLTTREERREGASSEKAQRPKSAGMYQQTPLNITKYARGRSARTQTGMI